MWYFSTRYAPVDLRLPGLSDGRKDELCVSVCVCVRPSVRPSVSACEQSSKLFLVPSPLSDSD